MARRAKATLMQLPWKQGRLESGLQKTKYIGDWMGKAVTSSSYIKDYFEFSPVILIHVNRIRSMTELFRCVMDAGDLRVPSTT